MYQNIFRLLCRFEFCLFACLNVYLMISTSSIHPPIYITISFKLSSCLGIFCTNLSVGLHPSLVLSSFLFEMVMDRLPDELRQESPWTMMFVDDIVICSERRQLVEENQEERPGEKRNESQKEQDGIHVCENEGAG